MEENPSSAGAWVRRRLMVRWALAVFGVGCASSAVWAVVVPASWLLFGAVSVVCGAWSVLLSTAGRRLPEWCFDILMAVGTVLVGVTLAAGPSVTDVAIIYVWPVLYAAYFFSPRRLGLQLAITAVVHAVVLTGWAPPSGRIVRWGDVVVSATLAGLLVSTLRRRMEALHRDAEATARIDALTCVLNRRGFDERLRGALAHAARHDAPLTLVGLDLDHFKDVNDRHGHNVGDAVLRCLGRVLLTCSRAEDVVARVGGEEFGVLLPDVDGVAGVRFAQRVQEHLAGALEANRLPAVTLSAGVAVQRGAARGMTTLNEAADTALYRAKREGRDRVCLAPGPAAALRPLAVAS